MPPYFFIGLVLRSSSSSRIRRLSAESEWKTSSRRRATIQRWAISTAFSTLALSRGLPGLAGITVVP